MTIAEARSKLTKRRLDRKWSFDTLYADVVRVLGADVAPSAPTLRRFVLKETAPEATTTHVIVEYLDRVDAEGKAA